MEEIEIERVIKLSKILYPNSSYNKVKSNEQKSSSFN